MGKLRRALRSELEAGADDRGFGKGWISGALALALALSGLGAVLFLKFPGLLSMPMLRDAYGVGGHPVPPRYLRRFAYPFAGK